MNGNTFSHTKASRVSVVSASACNKCCAEFEIDCSEINSVKSIHKVAVKLKYTEMNPINSLM